MSALTQTEPMSLLPAALRIAQGRGISIPEGLEWSLRVCRADLTSSHGFRWPFPGGWAEADPGGREFTTDGPCPTFPGDGLCVARTWSGAGSGGIPAEVVLLVGWAPGDVLCDTLDKLRVRRAFVADVLTVGSLLAERHPEDANLLGANLRHANLRHANLRHANLRHADLGGANLVGANLVGANLEGASR